MIIVISYKSVAMSQRPSHRRIALKHVRQEIYAQGILRIVRGSEVRAMTEERPVELKLTLLRMTPLSIADAIIDHEMIEPRRTTDDERIEGIRQIGKALVEYAESYDRHEARWK